jgi:hypothetical protein
MSRHGICLGKKDETLNCISAVMIYCPLASGKPTFFMHPKIINGCTVDQIGTPTLSVRGYRFLCFVDIHHSERTVEVELRVVNA